MNFKQPKSDSKKYADLINEIQKGAYRGHHSDHSTRAEIA